MAIYDLEERTFHFAKKIRETLKNVPNNIITIDDKKQLIRSSGSVGANYIEANEALGKKDFLMRIKISRKEAKESAYWLKLIIESNDFDNKNNLNSLYIEAIELTKIFSAIIEKSK